MYDPKNRLSVSLASSQTEDEASPYAAVASGIDALQVAVRLDTTIPAGSRAVPVTRVLWVSEARDHRAPTTLGNLLLEN